MNLEILIFNLKPVVFEAGDAIIEIYKNGAKAEYKEDGSPVTIADRLSEEIILKSLNSIAPNIPIVSEENSISHKKVFSDEYFLVDTLDGTKEFLDFMEFLKSNIFNTSAFNFGSIFWISSMVN